MAEPAARPNRALLIKLAVVGVVLLVGLVLVARGLDLKGLIAHGLELIRNAGPLAFFTAMALLPAVGMPLSAFALTAGSAFGPEMGMGLVVALCLLAVTINMALTYFLANRALRPLMKSLLERLGYRLPRAEAGDETDLIVLLRVTGLPFTVQNYLLGLAGLPFGKYLLVSCIVTWPVNAAFILFGDALLQGKGKVVLISFFLIVALAVATHLVRKHYGKKGPDTIVGDPGRILTVTEFTRRVREVLKGNLPPGWVQGEVSNLRAQASGHVYFSLKDEGAQLACVLFRGDAVRQAVKLREGLQVLACGEVDVYAARGQYQFITRALIEHGAGRLQQELEQLKQRLAAEGLFDAARKRPLPLLPRTIGFITSPTGAAVQDFIRILTRRGWTGRLVVLPARVQGTGAAADLVDMLETAAALDIFDLLVIGRGGGSMEDLWAFNEEPLVRAVAACPVPIISAVGHEIDFTLSDFAADVRAETPSGAAELISSNYVAAADRLARAADIMGQQMETALVQARDRLDHGRSRLRLLSPVAAIEQNHLRLDDLRNRLGSSLRDYVQIRRGTLQAAAARLAATSPGKRVQLDSHRLLALWKRLESASPRSVLQRGYAIVRDDQGRPVARATGIKAGQALVNEFHDGRVKVKVE